MANSVTFSGRFASCKTHETNGGDSITAQTRLDTLLIVCYQPDVRSELLKNVSRIVVKLGTGVLTDSRKQIEPAQLEQIVAQVAALRKAGKEVVVVTSAAVGAGMGALGFDTLPADPAAKKACAAVGHSRLRAT